MSVGKNWLGDCGLPEWERSNANLDECLDKLRGFGTGKSVCRCHIGGGLCRDTGLEHCLRQSAGEQCAEFLFYTAFPCPAQDQIIYEAFVAEVFKQQ